MTLHRKARCHCGSGRQYKACCYPLDCARADEAERVAAQAERDRYDDEADRLMVAASPRSRVGTTAILLALAAGGWPRGAR